MILVTGGTGFVGSAIVRELLKRGEAVAVLGRDAAKTQRAFANTVEARVADVTQPSSLQAAMAGADVVINAVQFPTSPIEVPKRGWTFEEVDYKGTLNQVDAAKAAGVKRFVDISAVGADISAEKHWFRLKGLAEQHLQQSGLEYVILRPTWVYGPNDHALNRLLGFTRFLPFLPLFGDGKQEMQPVFVDDIGWVAAEAVSSAAAANQVVEVGGPEVMTMNQVLKTGLSVLGRRRFILHQPVFVGKAIGSVAQLLPTPPLTPDAVEFITFPAVANNLALQRIFDPKLTPLREGLSTYLS